MSLLRASVLGGVDGTITSFAIVAGSDASGVAWSVVTVIGVSSLLADGLSMGISEFLSSTSLRAQREVSSGPASSGASPALLGASCFAAFVVCGAVPLGAYLLLFQSVVGCVSIVILELMALGAARTCGGSSEPVLEAVAQTLLLGGAAGSVAYGTGYLAHRLLI